jgi:hypothetical protein
MSTKKFLFIYLVIVISIIQTSIRKVIALHLKILSLVFAPVKGAQHSHRNSELQEKQEKITII